MQFLYLRYLSTSVLYDILLYDDDVFHNTYDQIKCEKSTFLLFVVYY